LDFSLEGLLDKPYMINLRQGSSEWLALRDTCAATASSYANALGIGYDSRAKYMRRKLHIDPPVESNWLMQFGNDHENWVCEIYFRVLASCGQVTRRETRGFDRDPDDCRLGGSVDGIITDVATGERWVLECKTQPNAMECRDQIPVSHICQMVGLMHHTGLKKAHYISWNPENGVFLAEVTCDPRLWDEVMYPRLKQFADWRACGVIPPNMKKADKQYILDAIDEWAYVTEIPSLNSRKLLLEAQETPPA
jgi:predicted phage-related endonuclease